MPRPAPRVKGLAVMLYLLGCALWGDLVGESAPLGSICARVASMMRCKRQQSVCLGSSEIKCLQG